MSREIKWRTPGSDVVHSIPDVSEVSFSNKHGNVVVGFDEDGSIAYQKHDGFCGVFMFRSEIESANVVNGYVLAMDYMTAVLAASDNPSDVAERIVEALLWKYPDVADEFASRF